jgi:hypothetical protein
MTRNVGITLTNPAYKVWREIPHGIRSKVISEFLIENAEKLTNLENPKKEEKSQSESIMRLLMKEYEEEDEGFF